MRTHSLLHDLFTAISRLASLRPNTTSHEGPPHDDASLASEPGIRNHQQQAHELEWLLIWLLVFIYFAGTYLFWARIEFAWPFSY